MGNAYRHDCETDKLSDYVDDELPADTAAAVEQHLSGCAECRRIVDELNAVAARARGLTDSPPDRDLWPAVAARIDAASAEAPRVLQMRARRRISFTLPQLVAASLALMLLSGSMVWLARLGGDRTDFPAVGAAPPVSTLPATFADTQYDAAIADLQQTLEVERAKLDPRTVRVLEQNLVAIDRAIEQCRSALAVDPSNAYLADHLAAAKKRKLALLRRASALSVSAGT
jgi:anti-sigma factor RsiW